MLTTAILRLTVFCENYFVYIKWFHGLYNYNLHVVFKIWGCSVGKSLKHGLHVPNISIYYQYIIMFWITNAHCFWRWNWFAPFWDYFLGGGGSGAEHHFCFLDKIDLLYVSKKILCCMFLGNFFFWGVLCCFFFAINISVLCTCAIKLFITS